MSDKKFCIVCSCEMKLVSTSKVKSSSGLIMRKRRYECTGCEYKDTVYGRGSRDEGNTQEAIIEAGNCSEKQFTEETEQHEQLP